MKSGNKGHQEEEEEAYEEFGAKKHATTSSTNNNTRDGKSADKATAMRSKHSVTEQRRRSKINERFQILRDLIPDSDQKRDTASFLLEVIDYVKFLQDEVQKNEGSYQPWSSEPTKLMPWRNSHWRTQSFPGQPQALKCGSGPGSAFPNRFDESNIPPTAMQPLQQNLIEPGPIRDTASRSMDPITEQANQAMGLNVPLQANIAVPIVNDGILSQTLSRQVSDEPSIEGPSSFDALNPQDELAIEGGTISISSVYSQGLLNSLAQALQSTGVDLSQANISVQINLGKRANTGSMRGIAIAKDHGVPMPSSNQPVGHFHDLSNNEDLDQAHKKLRIG